TELRATSCGYTNTWLQLPNEFDELLVTRSYYGAEMMVGGGYEWVSDSYQYDYYSNPDSLVDPLGPAVAGRGSRRGTSVNRSSTVGYRVSRRRFALNDVERFDTMRCARDSEVSP
ncbi:MAG: hypothetical protein DRJ42_25165, partial [Deltaproteobacteria bacterium]